jgi:serine/threonine protein kinase
LVPICTPKDISFFSRKNIILVNNPYKILKNLIVSGQVDKALKEVRSFFPKENTTLDMLLAQHADLSSAQQKGVLDPATYTQRKNQLTASLLDFIQNEKQTLLNYDNQKAYEFQESEKSFEDRLRELMQGRYEIKEEIGSGNSAILFKAYDIGLHRKVAIKVIRYPRLYSGNQTEHIATEIQTAAGYKHRNIMTLYAANMKAEPKYIVLEYVNGVNLSYLIKKTGPFPIDRVKDIIQNIAEALNYGHERNFIHRSIRPQNILIDKEGRPILSPFQLVRASHVQRRMIQYKEDMLYWCPEQLNDQPLSPQTDQFSLGVLAYEMIVGHPLFMADTVPEVLLKRIRIQEEVEEIRAELREHDCPEPLIDLLLRMLAPNPEDRWPSLNEMLENLAGIDLPLDEMILIVKESYDRCRANPQFLATFFEKFFLSLPEDKQQSTRAMFGNLDHHYKVINHAICLLISPHALEKSIQKIASIHGSRGLNIPPAFYPPFIQSLIDTASIYDTRFDEEPKIRNAWEQTTQATLHLIRSVE